MNDIAIDVRGVSKQFRLFRSGRDRLLTFFGMPRGEAGDLSEGFMAVRDLTVAIKRGSTVGIVGRNGAGKSTLLRLLAGLSEPTSGTLIRHGRVSALLELGAGFHQDLTGHDNIYASALYLGLNRGAVDSLYEDIVEFTELGPFLHQPVRTYSAGMYLRLAFAIATSLPADIQIIDEVLGVGDVYFFGKCMQRFRQFQAEGRTTVLVSHDQATMLRLCDRCLWIDRGALVADGTPLEVLDAYNRSVYAEQDRHEPPSMAGRADLRRAWNLRVNDAVRIEDAEFLTESGEPKRRYACGESLCIRIHYRSQVALRNAVVAVVIHRADSVTVCNAISSMDGAQVEVLEGRGALDVVFDPLLIGPGQYTISVGIYPELDLSDSCSSQHAVIWHGSHGFAVSQPAGVMMDLGVIRHPVRWRTLVREPRP